MAVSGGRMESKVVCLFFLAQRWFCKIRGICVNGRKVQKVYLGNGEALRGPTLLEGSLDSFQKHFCGSCYIADTLLSV